MAKSGGIMAAVSLVLTVLASAVISPLCGLCTVVVIGPGAGYLAGMFAKPLASGDSAKAGAAPPVAGN